MIALHEIEQAIDQLPRRQVFKLGEWLQQRLDSQWDAQFEDDVKNGKLDFIAHEALAEYRAGKSKPFPDNGK